MRKRRPVGLGGVPSAVVHSPGHLGGHPFLVGDYPCENEMLDTPILTMADGILWLYRRVERNSMVRKLEVRKIRGQNPMPDLHTLRITEDGIEVFPRMPGRIQEGERRLPRPRISTGVPGLDEMLGGGIPTGDSVLVAGPAGSGKTVLGTQFIAAGMSRGESGVIVVFEERPREYLERVREMGFDLETMAREGRVEVIYLRPLDLSVEGTLNKIQRSVERTSARRVLIDSISGFELVLAPALREDFQESLSASPSRRGGASAGIPGAGRRSRRCSRTLHGCTSDTRHAHP